MVHNLGHPDRSGGARGGCRESRERSRGFDFVPRKQDAILAPVFLDFGTRINGKTRHDGGLHYEYMTESVPIAPLRAPGPEALGPHPRESYGPRDCMEACTLGL